MVFQLRTVSNIAFYDCTLLSVTFYTIFLHRNGCCRAIIIFRIGINIPNHHMVFFVFVYLTDCQGVKSSHIGCHSCRLTLVFVSYAFAFINSQLLFLVAFTCVKYLEIFYI